MVFMFLYVRNSTQYTRPTISEPIPIWSENKQRNCFPIKSVWVWLWSVWFRRYQTIAPQLKVANLLFIGLIWPFWKTYLPGICLSEMWEVCLKFKLWISIFLASIEQLSPCWSEIQAWFYREISKKSIWIETYHRSIKSWHMLMLDQNQK